MVTVCWNCRGIGAASTVKELKDIIFNFKPQIVFLSETKAKHNKLQNLKRYLPFDNMFVVYCIGKAGGLCIFWKKTVKVQILFSNCNVIHTLITDTNANSSFHFSFVYGNLVAQQRKIFWATLRDLHQLNHKPWICSGDFNEILHTTDKDGGKKHSRNLTQAFKTFLTQKNMEELPQEGCRFTCCNNRRIGTIQEKLDRCVANWEWRRSFPYAIVTALVPISSDHSLLIIDTSPSAHRSQKSFKFEPFWSEHKDFEDIIRQSWKNNGVDIASNLNGVKSKLVSWSKETFKRADHRIRKLKNKLDHLHK